MQALELNDALLILASSGADDSDSTPGQGLRIAASAAGVACVGDAAIMVGASAVAQARLQPARINQRYWCDLSADPLGRAPRPHLSAADLAFEQLRALLQPVDATVANDPVCIIAVPAMFSRAQLGLLLGIASEAGVSTIGVVDAALAACALDSVPRHVLHLELYRHCAIVTAIEQAPGGARRARFEIDDRCSVQRLEQICLDTVAAQFVRQTRFDPLHEARSEQRLADALPELLRELQTADTAAVSLGTGSDALRVDVARGQWLAAAESCGGALLQLVQRARPAGQAIELRLGARAQAFPGLVERLQALGSCRVTLLPEAAAARGALLHANNILRGDEPVLVCQLPLTHAADEVVPTAATATPATHVAATHLLHGGRAWALQAEPLSIGTEPPAAQRSLLLPAGTPGVSRMHCRVRMQAGLALVEDHSTYGSFINDERIHGSAYLQRGDRLRLGTPGLTMEAIEVLRE